MAATLFVTMILAAALYFFVIAIAFGGPAKLLLSVALPHTALRSFFDKVTQVLVDYFKSSTTSTSNTVSFDSNNDIFTALLHKLDTINVNSGPAFTRFSVQGRKVTKKYHRVGRHGRPAIVQAPTGGYNCAVM